MYIIKRLAEGNGRGYDISEEWLKNKYIGGMLRRVMKFEGFGWSVLSLIVKL
jgi:hypothetical protein